MKNSNNSEVNKKQEYNNKNFNYNHPLTDINNTKNLNNFVNNFQNIYINNDDQLNINNDSNISDSKRRVNELLKTNEELKSRIIQLENELNQEKNISQNLYKKISYMQTEYDRIKNNLNEKDEINRELNEQILKLKNSLNNNAYLKKIIDLMEELKNKEEELKKIKSKLPFNISQNENLMTVIFYSINQKIHHSFICKNTDKFFNLESKLYDLEEYKEFGEYENYFLFKGKKINRTKTLEEIGIKNSDIITIVMSDSLE